MPENKLQRGMRDVPKKERHSCKTVSISPENHEKLKQIGNGNFSEGVRICLVKFLEEKNDK